MRGKVLGIIDGLDELIVKYDKEMPVKVGDIINLKVVDKTPNANKYYWELNGQLAQAENKNGLDMYKEHIKDMRVYDCLFMVTDAVPDFTKRWCSNHHGRFVDTRESKEENRTIVLAYYGSSDFDKAQMSRLIDKMVEDVEEWNRECRRDGRPGHQIQTLPPEEVKKLETMWGIKHDKSKV